MNHLGERPHAFDTEGTIPDALLPSQCYTKTWNAKADKLQLFAIAIIENAVRDLRSDVFRDEALAWLRGEITDGITFEACCESLDVEPDVILSRIDKVRKRATGYRSNQ